MTTDIIITAREGRGKHQWKTGEDTLIIDYPLTAATASHLADSVYMCTDSEFIADRARKEFGVVNLERPEELSRPDSQHADLIKYLAEKYYQPNDIMVVILGNNPYIIREVIDEAIWQLSQNDELTGVMSVWKAESEEHPRRALEEDENGFLVSKTGNSTMNRSDFQDTYFFDNQVWAFRAKSAIEGKGPGALTWMGERCKPIVLPWSAGHDVHNEYEVAIYDRVGQFIKDRNIKSLKK